VLEKVGGSSKLVQVLPLSNAPTLRKPDIGQVKEPLRWEPIFPLERGLDATIEYFRRQIS